MLLSNCHSGAGSRPIQQFRTQHQRIPQPLDWVGVPLPCAIGTRWVLHYQFHAQYHHAVPKNGGNAVGAARRTKVNPFFFLRRCGVFAGFEPLVQRSKCGIGRIWVPLDDLAGFEPAHWGDCSGRQRQRAGN